MRFFTFAVSVVVLSILVANAHACATASDCVPTTLCYNVTCPSGTCVQTLKGEGEVCRPKAGACDSEETCDSAGNCAAEQFKNCALVTVPIVPTIPSWLMALCAARLMEPVIMLKFAREPPHLALSTASSQVPLNAVLPRATAMRPRCALAHREIAQLTS